MRHSLTRTLPVFEEFGPCVLVLAADASEVAARCGNVSGTPIIISRSDADASSRGPFVKLLSRFEHGIERLMEGTTGSLFRQQVQPVEIGRKLERSMLSQKRASVGTSLVPNHFVVRLHPKDFAQFAEYRHGLARQMEAWLAQVATQRNLSVIDRIKVEIEEDLGATRRSPKIDATISDGRRKSSPVRRPTTSPAQATAAYQTGMPAPGSSAVLRIVDGVLRGKEIALDEGTTTVGRSPDNMIVLDASDVSRRHARFEFSDGRLRVHDLQSTNGTRVNGDPIRVSDVEEGDDILIGSQRMTVSLNSDRSSGGRRRR